MAKRRRGASEEDILLLALFLFGAIAVVGAMVVSVAASVLEVTRSDTAVLAEEMTPIPTATPAPAPTPAATGTAMLTATPTATPTLTPRPPTPADTTPPEQVRGLVAGPGGGSGEIQLIWDASPETDVDKYTVYRSETPGGQYSFVATVENDQVAWLPDGKRGFIDFPVSGAQWYVISAEDLAGNEGMMSDEACGAPIGDSCPAAVG